MQTRPCSVPTRSLGRNAQHLKSRDPFVPAAQQLISSSDINNRSAVLWADHQWNAEWLESTARLCNFISDIGIHLLEWPCQEQHGFRLTASTPVSDVFSPAPTKRVWPLLQLVSVAQRNRPLTMLSFTVQLTSPWSAWPNSSG